MRKRSFKQRIALRKVLRIAIKEAKVYSWRELVLELDPWGTPYKIVYKKEES